MVFLLSVGFILRQGAWAAEIAEIPRTLEELNRWYVEPPTNQNAARFVLKGVAEFDDTGGGYDSSRLLPGFPESRIESQRDSGSKPWVARSSQPWAEGRNAFGIAKPP
jgi:hypothetical protein